MKRTTLLTGLLFSLLFSSSSFGQGFTDVSAAAGLSFNHDGIAEGVDMPFGTGAAWLDYDRDGNIDLYVTSRESANKLFKNNGDGTFTDVAVSLGADDSSGDGAGVAIGDINNDGYPDIYLANGDEDVLLKNINGLYFDDITSGSGVGVSLNSRGTSASFGDYDNDGYLDLYVSHHVPVIGTSGALTQDFFFHNNGNETFTDVSSLLGLDLLSDPGFIAGWTDYDHDDDLDLILVNDCPFNTDFENNGTQVFRNDGGTHAVTDWTFTEVGATIMEDDCSNGMGIGIGDYNRDGWLDVVYTNVGPANLFKNNAGVFEEVSTAAGIEVQAEQHFSWGTSFFDYDNDGWQDIIMSVGALSLGLGDETQECNLFHNNGDGTFTDMAASLGMDSDARTRTITHADYDNDGDLDLFMVNYNASVALMRNDLVNSNHFLRIFLTGTDSNADGVGAKIEVQTPDGITQHFEMRSGSNLGGGDEVCAHFGLGANTAVNSVKVTWPSGNVKTLNNVLIDTDLSISESIPLPVELISFSAEAKGEEALLRWSTALEDNNKEFIIQRSLDGRNFKNIGVVAGTGNSTVVQHYDFIDDQATKGLNYYRLLQLDWDDQEAFSEIKVVRMIEENQVTIFPNPIPTTGDNLQVRWEATESYTQLEVFDALGRLIQRKAVANTSIDIITTEWMPGMYLLRLSGTTSQWTGKVLVSL